MAIDFAQVIPRVNTDSIKWQKYGTEVLPLWVADMDFQSPPAVLAALQQRVAHGVFGYGGAQTQLSEEICARLTRLYHWSVTPEDILFLPGLVSGLNVVCRAIGQPGDEVLVQTPVYPPFLSAPGNQARQLKTIPLVATHSSANTLHYELDLTAFAAAFSPQSALFLLCQPHNPVGRLFSRDELMQLAEQCLQHNTVICSDEIHCDLLLDGRQHIPMACLGPEIAQRCITLMAPSKTFNIAGLGCSFAVVQNPELRRQMQQAMAGILPEINLLGLTAALAAYQHGETWLQALLSYLAQNRDFVVEFVQQQLPGIKVTVPEATYLSWLDCRDVLADTANPQQFLLQQAKVALNDGASFGPGGAGFVRLNFGCSHVILEQALQRIQQACYSQA